MTEPIVFTSHTPRFELPLLFSGQAQKEFFINEAQLIIDALLHLTVEGTATVPPSEAHAGDCWIVGADAESDWAGQEDAIAVRHATGWKFITPKHGMTAYHTPLGQRWHFNHGWQNEASPNTPSGGTTVDVEARASIESLITSLTNIGVFAEL